MNGRHDIVSDEPTGDGAYISQSFDEDSLLKDEIALRIRDVGAEVLLQVGVLVVVDAHKSMTSAVRQILDHRGLANGGRALQ